MMFTIFDITIFTIIAGSSILGLYKGMLNMIINLLGFLASIVIAIFLYPYIKSAILPYVENELFVSILSAIISYVSSLVAMTIITSKVIVLSKGISRGILDRILGLFFGTFRGFVISIIIFTIIAILSSGTYIKAENVEELVLNLEAKKYPEWLTNSKTSDFLEKLLKKSISFIPADTLKTMALPKASTKENQDIIDDIKKTKDSAE